MNKKLPAYTVAQIEVTDPVGYQKYIEGATHAVQSAGGLFIVRGGRSFVLNGVPPKRIAIVQWQSFEQAQACYVSEAYKQLIPLRDMSSNFRAFIVEGAPI